MSLPAIPRLSDRERQELVGWILGLFRGPILAASGFPKAELQGTRGDADLMTGLGDYAPLLAAAGDRELALQQAELAFRLLSASPLLPGLRTRFVVPGLAARLLRRVGATDVQDYTKLLFGFVELHQVTGDARPLSWARWLSHWLLAQFGSRHGLASFWLLGRLPLYEPLTGTLIEGMLDYATLAGDMEIRRRALAALAPFLDNPVFRETGLWPSLCVMTPKAPALPHPALRRVDLAPGNTALASALLRAFQATSEPAYADAARRFLTDGVDALRARDGGLFGSATVAKGALTPRGPVTVDSHAVLEVLIDAHRVLRDDAMLRRALALAGFWRDQMHPSTGLLPQRLGGTECAVGANTELGVLFHKLFDVTGDKSWLQASETLVAAVARWHRTELGLVATTYVATGAACSPVIDVRDTARYLCPLLIPHGRSVFALDVLVALLRHR